MTVQILYPLPCDIVGPSFKSLRSNERTLLKKLSTKLGRLALLFMAIMGQIDMILMAATVAERSSFTFTYEAKPALRAVAWHIRHGDTVTYDGHAFHLPAYWYPEPNRQVGGIDLHFAPFGSLSLDSVHLATGQKRDGQTLHAEFAKTADHLNERSTIPNQWRVETLQGRNLTFQCLASDSPMLPPMMLHTLTCQASDSNLRVTLFTSTKSHTAALNILETSE